MEPEALALTLPIRRLVEFLLRTGSIDSRFTGFDRALEGARLHRKLQRAAVKEYPDYQAEAALKQDYACAQITYTLEGRADGIFTDTDGMPTIDEIKTTTLPPELITGEQSPEHWAQAQIYAAIYARQNGLPAMRVRLTYFQVDEELEFRFSHDYTADALDAVVTDLLTQYAPWAKRAAEWQRISRVSLAALQFPFPGYRPGQRAMIGAVYKICTEGGQLLCQAPTGIGKTMSVLFPALKAVGQGGPVFYLIARGTTRAAAENALALLRASDADLKLRSVTLTAKDKICMQDRRECTPEACPYAKGYYDRVRTALWDALDTHALTADALQMLARRHKVCPFELGLDLSLWCDVVIGDYNYLFDPVVYLKRFFDHRDRYAFLIDEAHNLLDRLEGEFNHNTHLRDMDALMSAAMSEAEGRIAKSTNGVTGIPTGLTDLDRMTSGLQNSDLIVLAARPGVGKTGMALHLARNAAMAGYAVAVYSLEMQGERLADRWLTAASEISARRWRSGTVSTQELAEAHATAADLARLPIHVDDSTSVNMEHIRCSARLLQSRNECNMIIIDYLQLCDMTTGQNNRNREQEVAQATRKAKLLAKELNVPVVLLSQLNRVSEGRPAGRPELSQLRESGAIEQDADVVLLLYRPALARIPTDRESGYPTEGLGIIIVAKQRNGETGNAYFGHNPEMTKITDYVPPLEFLLKHAK